MTSAGRRPGLRDPRAARRGAVEEEETTSGAAAFGKAMLAIVLALVIGAGASYGYYIVSTPKAPTSAAQPTTTPTTPTKKTTPTTGENPAHVALAAQGRLSASIAYIFADTAK